MALVPIWPKLHQDGTVNEVSIIGDGFAKLVFLLHGSLDQGVGWTLQPWAAWRQAPSHLSKLAVTRLSCALMLVSLRSHLSSQELS